MNNATEIEMVDVYDQTREQENTIISEVANRNSSEIVIEDQNPENPQSISEQPKHEDPNGENRSKDVSKSRDECG